MRECPVTKATCHNPECLGLNWDCAFKDYPFQKPSQGFRAPESREIHKELQDKIDNLERELNQCKKDIQYLQGLLDAHQ